MQTMGMAALPGLGQVFAENRTRPYRQAMEQRQGGIEDLTARLGLYPEPGEENWSAGGGGARLSNYGRDKLLPQQPLQPDLPPNQWDLKGSTGGTYRRNADNTDWEFEAAPDRSSDYASEGTSYGYRLHGVNRYGTKKEDDPRWEAEEKIVEPFRKYNQTKEDNALIKDSGDMAARAEMANQQSLVGYGKTLTEEQMQLVNRKRFAAMDDMRRLLEQSRAKAADPHALNPGGMVSTGNPDKDAFLQDHPELRGVPPEQLDAVMKGMLLAEEGAEGGGQWQNPPSPWLQNQGEPQYDPNDFSSYMRSHAGRPTP
jgi:hypothetical protein